MVNVSTVKKPNLTKEKKEVSVKKAKDVSINYDKINHMDSFNKFVRKKNAFLFGTTGIFLFLYILLPILAFTPVLQQKWIGNITGVWVYSAGLFVMTVVLCALYTKMAPKFDQIAADVLREYEQGGAE
jgi:uncharacterized membrane protein (DUF485 family)|uniref:DUF485 domain-containing protein n=1 Tax=Ureibacillus sp. FSL W7-1570 TaxID=2954593 RepID=UPI001ED3E7FA|nr:DUF485 domain-containing protein [Bacilli bacterium]